MLRNSLGLAFLAVCLLSANTASAQEKGSQDRPAIRWALEELNRTSAELREQLAAAQKEGNDERVAQLKAKVERVENNIRDTKSALQKLQEQQAVEKKAATDKAATDKAAAGKANSDGKSAERFERQLQELNKAGEQVRNDISAAEKEGNKERAEQLRGKAQRIENNLRETKLAFEKFRDQQVKEKQAQAERQAAQKRPADRPTEAKRPVQEMVRQAPVRPNVQRMEQMRSAERMLREGGLEDMANEVRNRADRWEQELRQQGEAANRQRQLGGSSQETGPRMEREQQMWRQREEALKQREEALRREAEAFQARQREMEQRMRAERENMEREMQRARQELEQERQRLRSEFNRSQGAPPREAQPRTDRPPQVQGINPERIGNALGEMKKSMEVFKQELKTLRDEVTRLKKQVGEEEDEDDEDEDDEDDEDDDRP